LSIELRHLRYVIAAAEHGSFRRAAEALNCEQSAISRRIRDLEDEVGGTLFIRSHSGVRLTEAGQLFLLKARSALDQINDAAIDVGAFGRGATGSVRIGIITSLAPGFLTDLLRAYAVANPGVRLDLVEGGQSAHTLEVQRLDLDVAFLTGEPARCDLDVAHLWNERLCVALPKDHELASKKHIYWRDLQDRHFVMQESDVDAYENLITDLCEAARRPSMECHAVGRDNLLHLVAMGRGLTLTSESATILGVPGVTYRPLRGHFLPFSGVWSPRNDNPALRCLLSLAKAMSRDRCLLSGNTGVKENEDGRSVSS